jgi:hypothetical protein
VLEQVKLIARAVPRLLGRVLLGAFVGGLLGLFLGLVVSTVAYFLGGSGSGWTALAIAAVSTMAFTIGGGYIGALRGCALALAKTIDELGLIPLMWNQLKPLVVRYAEAVRGGARQAEARAMAFAGLNEQTRAAERADGLAERAEIFVAGMLHHALAGGMLRGLLEEGETPWQDVEQQGLVRSQEVVGDLVARLFHGPALFAMLATIAAAVAPHAIVAATNL